ncbi:MAG: hypothetical protein AAF840_04040 [Bacteroidota bacterium]
MIQESTIERVLSRLEAGTEDFVVELQDFASSQPNLATYLTNEEHEILSAEERSLLLFGALVIFQSVQEERTEGAAVSEQTIGQAEEANYALMPEKGNFRDRLTPFFEASAEEELLAFVEDLIAAEAEEATISKEARAPMFISLKTVVDVLTA